jgi:hypothetical protein
MANPNYDRHGAPPDRAATTSSSDAVTALIAGWREALKGLSYRQHNLERAWRAATDDDRERFAATVTEWLKKRWAASPPASAKLAPSQH